jgi:hypothetical protein
MSTRAAEAPLVVSTDGTAGPYLIVTADQLGPVVQTLRGQGIPLHVDDEAVMLDGRPALMVIDLGHDADVERVQAILDHLSAERQRSRGRHHIPPSQQELIIKATVTEVEELIRRIESTPPEGWSRRADIEKRMGRMRIAREGTYCFSKRLGPDDQEYAVWVEPRGAGELHVPSIIPLRARQPLSVERHNEVLEDFRKTFVEPLVRGLKARPISYQAPTGPTLEDVLTTESMRRLESFSATANKAMLHPLDWRRWNSFVARTHLDNIVLETSLLSDWLQREGWPEPQRLQLVDDYEYGRSLLTGYDEERTDR